MYPAAAAPATARMLMTVRPNCSATSANITGDMATPPRALPRGTRVVDSVWHVLEPLFVRFLLCPSRQTGGLGVAGEQEQIIQLAAGLAGLVAVAGDQPGRIVLAGELQRLRVVVQQLPRVLVDLQRADVQPRRHVAALLAQPLQFFFRL